MKITGHLAPVDSPIGHSANDQLAPKGLAHVSLLDSSRADAPATVVGDAVIGLNESSFPIEFEFDVDTEAEIEPGRSYSIRAVVRDDEGRLRWTTDTVYSVDLWGRTSDQIDVGTLFLVAVGGPHRTSPPVALVGSWTVRVLDSNGVVEGRPPVVEFTNDGSVSGTTGCNRFTTTWRLDGDRLTLGNAATTRRACIPPLDQQEVAMLAVLADIADANVAVDVGADGDVLTIDTPGEHRLVADRAPVPSQAE